MCLFPFTITLFKKPSCKARPKTCGQQDYRDSQVRENHPRAEYFMTGPEILHPITYSEILTGFGRDVIQVNGVSVCVFSWRVEASAPHGFHGNQTMSWNFRTNQLALRTAARHCNTFLIAGLQLPLKLSISWKRQHLGENFLNKICSYFNREPISLIIIFSQNYRKRDIRQKRV